MKRFFFTALFLLYPFSSYAIDVVGDTEVNEYSLVTLSLKEKVDDADWAIDYINDLTKVIPGKEVPDKNEKGESVESFIFTGPPGSYKVRTWVSVGGKLSHKDTLVTIKPLAPPTPPPVPPTPGPLPPPTPVPPQDNPIPINSPGLRVLILYDSQQLGKYSQNQVAMLNDPQLRSYLASNCAVNNGVPEARYWSKAINIVNESDPLKQMMSEAKPASYPWLVVANGTSSYQGPIPTDVKQGDIINTIDKYKLPK